MSFWAKERMKCFFIWTVALQLLLCSVYIIFVPTTHRCFSFTILNKLTISSCPVSGPSVTRFPLTIQSSQDGRTKSADASNLPKEVAFAAYIANNQTRLASPVIPESASLTDKDGLGVFTTEDRIPGSFQPIDNSEAWVYSAFFDHVAAEQGNPVVRAEAVIKAIYVKNATCQCHFIQKDRNFITKGRIRVHPDPHQKLFLPSFIICPLEKELLPKYVSFTFNSTKMTNQLPVLYPAPRRIRNFTVCHAVLHSGYDSVSQLIQSIEINRILGANHFVVYNYSVSPYVNQILHHYQNEGLLTVQQWPLPKCDVWYYAQMTAINDCVFRNRNTSEFVVVVDPDEIIVPRQHRTWMDMIVTLETQQQQQQHQQPGASPAHNRTIASFEFKSSRFGKNSTKDLNNIATQFSLTKYEKTFINKYKMNMLSDVWHSKINGPRQRSKYIVRPNLLEVGGIHFPREFTRKVGFKIVDVSEDVALVHHYRYGGEFKAYQDTDILKFKTIVFKRLSERIKHFPEIYPQI